MTDHDKAEIAAMAAALRNGTAPPSAGIDAEAALRVGQAIAKAARRK